LIFDSCMESPGGADAYKVTLASEEAKACFLMPFDQDTQFIGREDIIASIDHKLKIRRRVALAGIGGVG
jgi:hypothetical protein